MIQSIEQLFRDADEEAIVSAITTGLGRSEASPFWAEKTPRYAKVILSVLLPLRDQGLLFNPEGAPQDALTPQLFLRWCDLVSLKSLAFILRQSNDAGQLLRTGYDVTKSSRYLPVDTATLHSYLAEYMISLDDELLDFPITHYNLHQGITDVLADIIGR